MMNHKQPALFAIVLALTGLISKTAAEMNVLVAPKKCEVNPIDGNVLQEHYFHSVAVCDTPEFVRQRMKPTVGRHVIRQPSAARWQRRLRT